MAEVNMSSILSKCQAYSKTADGKQKMKEVVIQKMRNGDGRTGCGDEILTIPQMNVLAKELISTIKLTASSYDLAESVMRHFDSLTYTVIDAGDGIYECYIYFTDDLSRPSLETDENQGEGINNIVALFNNGYVAKAPKYGWWNGHSPTGESVGRALTGTESYAYIKGTQARPSLRFMQRAIEDFASKYLDKYVMSITLNEDDYDGHYLGSPNGIISKL